MTKKVQNIAQNQDANLYFQSTLRRVAKHQKIEFKPPVSPLTPMGLEPILPQQTDLIKGISQIFYLFCNTIMQLLHHRENSTMSTRYH